MDTCTVLMNYAAGAAATLLLQLVIAASAAAAGPITDRNYTIAAASAGQWRTLLKTLPVKYNIQRTLRC